MNAATRVKLSCHDVPGIFYLGRMVCNFRYVPVRLKHFMLPGHKSGEAFSNPIMGRYRRPIHHRLNCR
jgi:hypothetical protein